MNYTYVLLLCGVAVLVSCTKPSPHNIITTFDECVLAGNPIAESYPEQCTTSDGKVFINEQYVQPFTIVTPNLHILSLEENQVFESQVLQGEARGWYFEGSFPIELRNGSGEVVVQTFATALQDWMTTDWVPFTADITVPETLNGPGTIVFKKDNASGEPEFDEEYEVPVLFN